MRLRLDTHDLKMAHLDLLFERELKQMKTLSFHRMRNKRYKQLALALQSVTPKKKQIVLHEYFSMCKMVYRIRSTEAYMIGEHTD